ncbi:MAG TPA: hypothetical protein VNT60_00855 [Deinococcales bacterium]|nr:hypothetical protein [Deinococcales bacterium]
MNEECALDTAVRLAARGLRRLHEHPARRQAGLDEQLGALARSLHAARLMLRRGELSLEEALDRVDGLLAESHRLRVQLEQAAGPREGACRR